MLTQRPTLSDIEKARVRTEPLVKKTPILTSEYFNDLLGIAYAAIANIIPSITYFKALLINSPKSVILHDHYSAQ